MEDTNFTFRMNKQLKNEAEELFSELGLTLSAAFTLFLKQSIREQGIPFKVKLETPNKETIKAIKEADRNVKHNKGKTYHSVDELMEDLHKWFMI